MNSLRSTRSLMAGLAGIAGVCAAFAISHADAGPTLVKGVLTVEAGDYRVEFREQGAWTLGNVSFRKKPLLTYTGANQTVVQMMEPPRPGAEPWIGTNHGGEEISQVALEVDGNPYSIILDMNAPEGREYALVKQSKIGPLRMKTRTAVSEAGVHQSVAFEADGALESARYLYVFMHCWGATMTEWLAVEANGATFIESAPPEKTTSLKRDIAMLAVYSPEMMTGAVLSYPTPYEGAPGHSNSLINWPGRHNKHYLRMTPGQVVGKEFSCWIKGFNAPPAAWQEEAARLHHELESH